MVKQPHFKFCPQHILGGLINIFTVDASIIGTEDEHGEIIPAAYHGLDRYVARKQIIADLEECANPQSL